jgi:mannose-1-phosphate guanylyltransferase/mannose-6-phosphate isomerase
MTRTPTTPILPVILSGGSGTRLWPLSREGFPKQFLPLLGEASLIQETVARTVGIAGALPPLVVCSEATRFLVAGQLQAMQVTPSAIMLEPVGRNTAPALGVAALWALKGGTERAAGVSSDPVLPPDPLLLVLPADHGIRDVAAFQDAVRRAVPLAEAGYLVTFGVRPHRPETGYGYIEQGAPLTVNGAALGFGIARFVEKPDPATAEGYVAGGRHLWNSGMFLFRASAWLEALERHRPDIAAGCARAIQHTTTDLDFVRLDPEGFAACPAESIDYAVMEPTDRGAVLPLEDLGWSDVGSWGALWEVLDAKDPHGNACQGDVMAHDTEGSLLYSTGRLVAAVGVRDLMIIETPDAVLVAAKDRSQDVRAIVDQLRREGRSESELHRTVHRPWGSYTGIDQGEGFQVKRITVNPGGRLSLQTHAHRAEHWVVVHGVARVTCGERTFDLHPNESTYIPLGAVHRLENPGTEPVHLIEVQSGSYLGEDDIVRLDDVYGRGEYGRGEVEGA